MDYVTLTNYWIIHHNEKYYKYILSADEPRYAVKTFFLNSFRFFKILGEEWETYIERYDNLFRRDPSGDFYSLRDPTDPSNDRANSLEWSTLFEIVALVGFPHNESGQIKFRKYSREFLKKAMKSPNSPWVEFMLCSAVANLPNEYDEIREWLPSQLEKWLKDEKVGPHQLVAYLKAIKNCGENEKLQNEINYRLMEWIKNPVGTANKQVLIWARLMVSMQWLEGLTEQIENEMKDYFFSALGKVYSLESNWSNSPLLLEAYYVCADQKAREDIRTILRKSLSPSSFFKFQELFPFLRLNDDASEVKDEVTKVKEKCKPSVSRTDCKACIATKQGDCWIRVISKLTNTKPELHSGYEVADKVIYSLDQGVYIVIKATPIMKQIGEGDVLYRQCVSLFSVDHALVLYLNPCETAPFVIEEIKHAASNSKTNPRFEVIDHKYIRQMYREYSKEK